MAERDAKHDRAAVLTRPGAAHHGLARQLRDIGWTVLDAPALAISPLDQADDAVPLPADADLVVFVSGNAARIYLDRLAGHAGFKAWPAHVAAAAVGAATARALRQHPVFGATPTLYQPDTSLSLQDSEGLYDTLRRAGVADCRVLIVRGETGRPWLAERLEALGCRVTRLAMYRRAPADWPAGTDQTLARWAREACQPVWLYTSSDSVDAVAAHILRVGLTEWWWGCPAVVTHPRIADALGNAMRRTGRGDTGTLGSPMVKISVPDDQALFEAFVAL